MDKKQQFITEVQTGLILRYLGDGKSGHKAMWHALINLDDAFYAAERIPSNMTAHKAACEFLEFIFKDSKDPEPTYASWFLRS
jgi:hypothetical protein